MSEISDLSLDNVCLSPNEANQQNANRLCEYLFQWASRDDFTGEVNEGEWPLLTYGDVMDHFGWNRIQLIHIMRALFERDHQLDRPHFTALIVGKRSGVPSEGYWHCWANVGLDVASMTGTQRINAWRQEVGKVIGFTQGMSYNGGIP